jgi:hypothetical protein
MITLGGFVKWAVSNHGSGRGELRLREIHHGNYTLVATVVFTLTGGIMAASLLVG